MAKRKERILRFRKNAPEHNLLAAVQHFVRANGGSIVVIGGIETQDWGEGLGKFRIAVKCLGRKPAASGGQP